MKGGLCRPSQALPLKEGPCPSFKLPPLGRRDGSLHLLPRPILLSRRAFDVKASSEAVPFAPTKPGRENAGACRALERGQRGPRNTVSLSSALTPRGVSALDPSPGGADGVQHIRLASRQWSDDRAPPSSFPAVAKPSAGARASVPRQRAAQAGRICAPRRGLQGEALCPRRPVRRCCAAIGVERPKRSRLVQRAPCEAAEALIPPPR